MPHLHFVEKSRKPQECQRCGVTIPVGSRYLHWQFRYGGRNVRCSKPECRPRRSDLTRSEYLGQLYDMQDSWEKRVAAFREVPLTVDTLEELASDLTDMGEAFQELAEEQREHLDAMPEGLQQGSTGELLEERASGCEEASSEAERIADEIRDRRDDVEAAAAREGEEKPEGEAAEAAEDEERPEDEEETLEDIREEVAGQADDFSWPD